MMGAAILGGKAEMEGRNARPRSLDSQIKSNNTFGPCGSPSQIEKLFGLESGDT